MTTTSLFAGSFDLIHNGHLSILKEISEYSDKVIVAILNNDEKIGKYLFSLKERIEITKRAIVEFGLNNVTVLSTEPHDLLVDIYLKNNCTILFRGIRNPEDKSYEETQMSYHKLILPDLNVGYIRSKGNYGKISSSLIKTFVQHHVDISSYVPAFIKKQLEERIAVQYKIGITGQMATGKSFVTDELVKYFKSEGISVKSIKLDDLIREVYDEDSPSSDAFRKQLANFCQKEVINLDGKTVNRKKLAQFMFDSTTSDEKRKYIQDYTKPLINMKYREALHNFKGLVLVEWAQLAEMGMGNLVNHNVVVVDSPNRAEFIKQRGLSDEDVEKRGKFQWSAEKKIESLQKSATLNKIGGNIINYSNVTGDQGAENLIKLGKYITSIFDL